MAGKNVDLTLPKTDMQDDAQRTPRDPSSQHTEYSLGGIPLFAQTPAFTTIDVGKMVSGVVDSSMERQRIDARLNGFDPKNNPAWYSITQKFGANIKQSELLSIATVLANSANIKLDRDAKRRKTVLIKWFEENWNSISHLLNYVVLEDVGTN